MQINCLNLLLVLLLGVIPCKIHATDTKESVMLYTPYTKISEIKYFYVSLRALRKTFYTEI